MKISPQDRKILDHLQRDASMSLDSLGALVGLSRNACWRRIKQMEEDGVITARVALVDAHKLGLGLTVFMAIRTDNHSAQWLADFARATKLVPEIQSVYRMSGELDYLIRARISDISDYDRIYKQLIEKVALSDVSASFVMEEIKETTALPL